MKFLRLAVRLVFMVVAVAATIPLRLWVWLTGPRGREANRAAWLQTICRWALCVLRIRVVVRGTPPSGGLVVANHLGYADIVSLGSAMPCRFVSKASVRHWPVFGPLVVMAGTLFVEREKRGQAAEQVEELTRAAHGGLPVVFFPEGTTSDGAGVLPFRSSLLAAATQSGCPVTPVAISALHADGSPNRELPYYGGDLFVPHLLRLLAGGKRSTVVLEFGAPQTGTDRKELAVRLRDWIVAAR
jgi:1-acyl-sn-glycerol-3-phosphate acyltransferase